MSEEISKKSSALDVIPTDNLVNKVKDAIQNYKLVSGKDLIPDDIIITDFFQVGGNWNYYDELKKKTLFFAFHPTKEQKERWINVGFAKLPHLLLHLKKIHGDLDKFDVVFFKRKDSEPFYIVHTDTLTIYFINLDTFQSYSDELNPILRNLRVTKYSRKITSEFAKKVPVAFFKKEKPSVLSEELRNSRYKVIEFMIKEFENMDEPQREELKKSFESSKLGTEIIKKYVELKPESPEIQLKLFLEIVDKLGEKEVNTLLNSILKSKVSKKFIQNLANLSIVEQNKIAKKMPEMAKMYDRYIKLEKSLKEFKKKIKEHVSTSTKDEKDIHKFLTKNYWLLGIEYFGKDIASDIDSSGKRTGKTNIGKKHADFIIQRLDGLDKCVIIELEEANDAIFNNDGTFSKKVYDGINQAVDYSIENKMRGTYSKGIAIIGSLSATDLSETQKTRLILLNEAFHNVDILTYDQIIEKAESTLDFWKKYEEYNTEV